eukprot:353811-Chlamydomonas_euryale.AAC.4
MVSPETCDAHVTVVVLSNGLAPRRARMLPWRRSSALPGGVAATCAFQSAMMPSQRRSHVRVL